MGELQVHIKEAEHLLEIYKEPKTTQEIGHSTADILRDTIPTISKNEQIEVLNNTTPVSSGQAAFNAAKVKALDKISEIQKDFYFNWKVAL